MRGWVAMRATEAGRRLLTRFAEARDGVAAVEFAMIVPMMVMLFIGAVEFSQAISADRRVTQVASSTADLVARARSTTKAELEGILDIASKLMPAPTYDPTQLKITLVSVEADINNAATTKVGWSCKYNGGVNSYSNGQAYSLPSGVVEKGDSVIVAEVEYNYVAPIFNEFLGGSFKMSEKFYLKPRLSAKVTYEGAACS
ncbi:MAG: TadE/TadG family type IV pilus assembly protein [Hyphomicrobiaceae bacterium]